MLHVHDLQQAVQSHWGTQPEWAYLWALLACAVWYALFRFFKATIVDRLETMLAPYARAGALRSGLVPLLYWGVLYTGLGYLHFPAKVTALLQQVWMVF